MVGLMPTPDARLNTFDGETREEVASRKKGPPRGKGVKLILSGPPFSFGRLDGRYGCEAQFMTKPGRSNSIYQAESFD